VGPTGLTGRTRPANFGCEYIYVPCFLVKFACQKTPQRSKLAKDDDQQFIAHIFAPKGDNCFIGHKLAFNS
jgi:hypothetical protein